MSINEIYEQLVKAQVDIAFAYNKDSQRIKFSDNLFDRTLLIGKKSNQPELLVYIAKTRKPTWDTPQTDEQNKECAKEKNHFIKEVFNKLPIDFKLKEFEPKKYEVYDPTKNTKGSDSKLEMPNFK
ncbi:hypothetical protein [Burkholderia gladioli]|uniref:hypothetical protein n=1 Tax=Burkholderia gladioli TaxID=28095 RepID=UPI00163F85E0|nr:hypothetical protein [Burkholderia gladioli]